MSVVNTRNQLIIIDQLTKEALLCVKLGEMKTMWQPPNFDLYSVPALLVYEKS